MTQQQTIPANGFAFTAQTAGQVDRPLVMLLHGFPHSSYSWRHQLPALAAEGYFAVAPDQRGYSVAARPSGVQAFELDHLVSDVLEMARHLGHDRFDLVGHDWGGQVAWAVAARSPQSVRSLTVLSRPHPAAFRHALQHDPEQQRRSIHHSRFQDPAMADRLLANGMARVRALLKHESLAAMFDDALLAAVSTQARPRMSDADVDAYCRVLSDRSALEAALNWYRASFSGSSALASAPVGTISVPTRLLWGNEDVSVGRLAAEGSAAYVTARFRLVEIAGAGHFLSDQVPERVTAELIAHLRSTT